MEIKDYVFLAGNTALKIPETGIDDHELEKLQVLGFSSGQDAKDALKRLVQANKDIFQKALSGIFSFELSGEKWKSQGLLRLE